MLETYVVSDRARRQLRRTSVGEFMDGFAAWLRSAGYKRRPGQLALRGAAHLGEWASSCGSIADRLGEEAVNSFTQHLVACACTHPFRGSGRYHAAAARRFVEHLRSDGHVPLADERRDTFPPLIADFGNWMRLHRGVTESTLGNYLPLAKEFLEAIGGEAVCFDAAAVRSFIFARASRHGPSRAKSVTNAVRMFLRFLATRGDCSTDLIAAVPRIAEWKQSSLPRYISAGDVARLVEACDPMTTAGSRDRAVILLLARLGLRASDVRELRLADIDWLHGRLRVMGKGRCETWLPLPQDVGDAVSRYVERLRPALCDDHVFLRVHAPFGPLPSSGPISKLVRRAIQRAGIETRSMGAHLLRHSAATEMLRKGSSLEVIGAVLRHRCIDSTAHYAKVDVALLRSVAQPWPAERCSSC